MSSKLKELGEQPEEILDIYVEPGVTVKDYLNRLLSALWNQGEGFNAKRPFGNSGWKLDIALALVKDEIIDGELDEFGDLEEINEPEGTVTEIIQECIDAIFEAWE